MPEVLTLNGHRIVVVHFFESGLPSQSNHPIVRLPEKGLIEANWDDIGKTRIVRFSQSPDVQVIGAAGDSTKEIGSSSLLGIATLRFSDLKDYYKYAGEKVPPNFNLILDRAESWRWEISDFAR